MENVGILDHAGAQGPATSRRPGSHFHTTLHQPAACAAAAPRVYRSRPTAADSVGWPAETGHSPCGPPAPRHPVRRTAEAGHSPRYTAEAGSAAWHPAQAANPFGTRGATHSESWHG